MAACKVRNVSDVCKPAQHLDLLKCIHLRQRAVQTGLHSRAKGWADNGREGETFEPTSYVLVVCTLKSNHIRWGQDFHQLCIFAFVAILQCNPRLILTARFIEPLMIKITCGAPSQSFRRLGLGIYRRW
jgi:hypothetical protein